MRFVLGFLIGALLGWLLAVALAGQLGTQPDDGQIFVDEPDLAPT